MLPPVPHPPLRGTPLVTAGIAWGAPQKFQSGERSRERTRQGWEGAQRTPRCPRSVRKAVLCSLRRVHRAQLRLREGEEMWQGP